MRIIREANGLPARILGKQEFSGGGRLRLTTLSETADTADGRLFFHTLTGTMLLLSPEEDPNDPALRETLAHEWFLVPDAFDEIKTVDTLRETVALMAPREKHVTSFTILTTTDCNARCAYCYERGRKRIPMTVETAEKAAAYMRRASGGKKIHITWFGGEPLCNQPVMELISERLAETGADFDSEIVTNGLLMTPETAEHAAKIWRLTKAQVTLDGPKDVYGRIKNYRNYSGDAYETVLANLRGMLRAGIRVQVRINVVSGREETYFRLAEDLAARFKGEKRFIAVTAPVADFQKGLPKEAERARLTASRLSLMERLDALGLSTVGALSASLAVSRCMADNDSAEVILPDGRLGKCEHFSESEIIGIIDEDTRDEALVQAFKERFAAFTECKDCPLYPRCVNLKKCEWLPDGCIPSAKEAGRHTLRREMIAAYEAAAKKDAP